MKCSGTQPCNNCERRKQSCFFDEAERKIVVSERSVIVYWCCRVLKPFQGACVSFRGVHQETTTFNIRLSTTTHPRHPLTPVMSRVEIQRNGRQIPPRATGLILHPEQAFRIWPPIICRMWPMTRRLLHSWDAGDPR